MCKKLLCKICKKSLSYTIFSTFWLVVAEYWFKRVIQGCVDYVNHSMSIVFALIIWHVSRTNQSLRQDYAVSYVNSLGAGAVFSTLKHNWRGKNIKNYFQRKVYWPCILSVDIGKTEVLFQRTYPLERIRSLWRFFFSFLFWFLESLDACSDDFERSDPVPLAVCSLHFSSFGSPLFLDTALRLTANENKTSSTEVV